MPIHIKSVQGYYFLDAWVMANIIQLSTIDFCRRHLNKANDPCGRQYDQMTQAARSITANIAEGASRHQTSRETEMKLTDVARASACELHGDYLTFSLLTATEPWARTSEPYTRLAAIKLDEPLYTDDWQREAWLHIMRQKKKFDPWTAHPRLDVSLNAMLQLVSRETVMLEKLIAYHLRDFKENGGFTENLTQERITALKEAAQLKPTPRCPICGGPMKKVMAKKGINSGHEFWSCLNYPNCKGTRPVI